MFVRVFVRVFGVGVSARFEKGNARAKRVAEGRKLLKAGCSFLVGSQLFTLWFRTAMYRDVSTEPLARPFARPSACSALRALLARSAALICSLICLLSPELVGKRIIRCPKINWFCPTVLQFNNVF